MPDPSASIEPQRLTPFCTMNRTMDGGADTYGTGIRRRQRGAEVPAHAESRVDCCG